MLSALFPMKSLLSNHQMMCRFSQGLMQRQGIVLQSLPKFTSRSLSGSRISTSNRVIQYQNVAKAVRNVWGGGGVCTCVLHHYVK